MIYSSWVCRLSSVHMLHTDLFQTANLSYTNEKIVKIVKLVSLCLSKNNDSDAFVPGRSIKVFTKYSLPVSWMKGGHYTFPSLTTKMNLDKYGGKTKREPLITSVNVTSL
ncbi:hypothetical protein AMECASPLE_022621 [Ameca splendens]|uniref:Uncharacterized protein n=1 Tax=Ameca splendens TaxID=208324 RepID=A0ABV1AA76_9TELE